ncbi:hypothetical protein GCK72_021913 [Caenorhabditis remanei]|uniref:Uncharacterized protein n=1 Tax=Caenorhabditis remanei TaxID=31234 RepID=A0A6A5GL03_CAERE|nr:hypothetical protein GCK72_021913 [Caenorhabditis remanei]KAF1755344.1 hypothetical protein GCK72_021913 [Caenorhabditis remanei]
MSLCCIHIGTLYRIHKLFGEFNALLRVVPDAYRPALRGGDELIGAAGEERGVKGTCFNVLKVLGSHIEILPFESPVTTCPSPPKHKLNTVFGLSRPSKVATDFTRTPVAGS